MKKLLLFGCLVLVGCEDKNQNQRYIERENELMQQGRIAFEAGVPPNANPWMDYPESAKIWLDGYIMGKTTKEAQEK